MQRKSVRIMASLIFSVMLLALPLGAVLANSSTVTLVCAEEGTEETTENRTDISGNDETSAGEDGVEEENPRNENGGNHFIHRDILSIEFYRTNTIF